MVYEKRGQWCVRVRGQLKKFPTKAEAMKAAGMVDKGPDPLEALRSAAPVYDSLEEAVEDQDVEEVLSDD